MIKTQEVGYVYNMENKYLTTAKLSMEFYEIFANTSTLFKRIYMFGRAFLIQNSCNVEKVVDSLKSVIDEEAVVKKSIVGASTKLRVTLP